MGILYPQINSTSLHYQMASHRSRLAGGRENYSLFNMNWNENATLFKTCKVTYYGNCLWNFNVSAAQLMNLLWASLEFLFEMIVLVTECTTESENIRNAIWGCCYQSEPFIRAFSATTMKPVLCPCLVLFRCVGWSGFSRSSMAHNVICAVV